MDFANDPRSSSPTDAIILPSIQELFPGEYFQFPATTILCKRRTCSVDHLLSSPLALRGRPRRGYSGPNVSPSFLLCPQSTESVCSQPHPHHGHLSATSGVHMNSIQTGDGPSWAFNVSREPTAHYATSTPSADTYRDSSRLPPRPLSAESIHPYGLHSSAQRIEPTPLTFYVHNDYLPRGSSAANRSPSSQPTIHSQPSTQWQKSTSTGNSRLCTSPVTSTGCSSESSTQGSNTQSDWQYTRRYICPTCSKAFNRPSSLDVHCLIHSGLKRKCIQTRSVVIYKRIEMSVQLFSAHIQAVAVDSTSNPI